MQVSKSLLCNVMCARAYLEVGAVFVDATSKLLIEGSHMLQALVHLRVVQA